MVTVLLGAGGFINTPAQRFQLTFSAEDEIKRSVKIPAYAVREIIRRNDRILPSERKRAEKNFLRLAKAAKVDLNGDRFPDLLVRGDPGANITGFWLFRNVRGRWEYMLETRAHDLAIEQTKSKGYYDISITAMSAIKLWETTYKFNGTHYTYTRCAETELGKEKPKTRYYKCPGSSVKPYV